MSTYSSPKVSLSASLTRLGGQSDTKLSSTYATGRSRALNNALGSGGEDEVPIEAAPIVCMCHLGWDWVWQRPQQFLSRFSKTHPVLFIETYCSDTTTTYTKVRTPEKYPNLVVAEIHVPQARWHDGEYVDSQRLQAVRGLLSEELAGRFDRPILWFYDPMAVTAFAGQLEERLIVYDCMDELSQFKGAPPELLIREKQLLKVADVVFCGGRKMREKRLPLNANCHFYGTGVDIAHFGRARTTGLAVAPELAAMKGPILGYFGVVDERIDYDLLAKLAEARADWHVVVVGPAAKVDPNEFPRRDNLHFIGGRTYDQLPALTKAFSVCLMPFAINAATEYINPTKALEYMAAGKPVVSTAINEVKTNFSSVARVAATHQEFITACIREAESPSFGRVRAGLQLAADNTWEAICAKMELHITDADQLRHGKAAARNRKAGATATATMPVDSTGLAYV